MSEAELAALKKTVEGLSPLEAQRLLQRMGLYGWVIPIPANLRHKRDRARWIQQMIEGDNASCG